MRIAIMGGLGTGKTTLCQALADRFKVPVAPEALKELVNFSKEIEACKHNPQALSKALKKYAAYTQDWLEKRSTFQAENSHFVMDCCCFDVLYRWIRLLNFYGEDDNLLERLIHICRQQSKQLELITVLPLNLKSRAPDRNEDGLTRNPRLSQRILHQATIYGVLQQFSMAPVLNLRQNNHTLTDRIEKIIDALDRLNALPPAKL